MSKNSCWIPQNCDSKEQFCFLSSMQSMFMVSIIPREGFRLSCVPVKPSFDVTMTETIQDLFWCDAAQLLWNSTVDCSQRGWGRPGAGGQGERGGCNGGGRLLHKWHVCCTEGGGEERAASSGLLMEGEWGVVDEGRAAFLHCLPMTMWHCMAHREGIAAFQSLYIAALLPLWQCMAPTAEWG